MASADITDDDLRAAQRRMDHWNGRCPTCGVGSVTITDPTCWACLSKLSPTEMEMWWREWNIRMVLRRGQEPVVAITVTPMTGAAAGSCTWGPDEVTFTHEAERVRIVRTRSH